MKIPESWNDKSLLQDEPFRSAFQSHTAGIIVKGAHKVFTKVAYNLRTIKDIDYIIEQWLEIIFFGLKKKKKKSSSKLYNKCDFKDLQLFVEIQSYLARDNEVAAFKTINRHRIARGLKSYDDVKTFEEARASYIEKKRRTSGTRPEGPYNTRQLAIQKAPKPTEPLSSVRSSTNDLNIENFCTKKTLSNHPTVHVHKEVNKKISRKRRADTLDSRPAKRRVISKPRPEQYCGPVTVKPPRARRFGNIPTIPIRKNPPCSAEHDDKTTGSEDPAQDVIGHPDTSTTISVQQSSAEYDIEVSPPDKRLPEVSSDSRGNQWRAIVKTDSSNFSLDIVHSPSLTAVDAIKQQSALSDFNRPDTKQQDQTDSFPLVSSTVRFSTADDHDFVCPVQISNYISYAHNDSPSTALHEKLTQANLPIVKTVSNPFVQFSEPASYASYLPVRKPLLFYPPIWAQSRQEVCETFDWFRSFQGGVYHANGMVKGYLLSGFPSSRDRFEHDGRLIISHGGGKAESIHTNKGQMASQQATDQTAQDKSIRALLNNHRYGRPLALLIDDRYALFPYDIGFKDITYAVLGFYTIAHVWAEYQPANNEQGRVVRYKFAFRWCEDQGSPWWLKENKKLADTMVLDDPCPKYENRVPAHLEDSCDDFSAERLADGDTDGRLLETRLHTGFTQPEACRLPVRQDTLSDTRELCAWCCKPSPRIFLCQWTCLIPECIMFWKQVAGQEIGQFINNLTYDPQFLALPLHKPLPYGYQDTVKFLSKREITADSLRNYHITRGFHCNKCGRLSCRFQWEKWECSHCHNYLNVSVPLHLAQDIWNQPLPTSYKNYNVNPISDIVSITSATFSHDAGRGVVTSFVLPYYRGKIHHIQTSNPRGREEADKIFLDYQKEAAAGILKFRRWPLRATGRGPLLTNYFSHNAGKPYKYVAGDANTVPFESAPAVCAARALIEKRIKQALDIPTHFNEVLSAAYMERQRMAFHSDNEVGLGPVVAGLSLGSPALMHFRLHPRFDPEREKRGILLSIILRHGDVLVMDGAGIQEYYEHTVVPNNFRIAATARQIGDTHS